MNTLIVYHDEDFDGKCAGAVALRARPGAEIHGHDYSRAFPWEKAPPGRPVVMVDLSLPMEDMARLAAGRSFVWIDHHETAIEAAADWPAVADLPGLRRVGTAGCELAWEYFAPEPAPPAPLAVRLLGRWDVWDRSEPRAVPFQWGMRSLGHPVAPDHALWATLFADGGGAGRLIESIMERGRAVLQYAQGYEQTLCRRAAETVLFNGGIVGVAVNTPVGNSDTFASVYDPQRHQVMVRYHRHADRWHVSLYSDQEGVHVGRLAKECGGGGHQGAAGFSCEELPFVAVGGA